MSKITIKTVLSSPIAGVYGRYRRFELKCGPVSPLPSYWAAV